jgi:hypothetical protein
MFTNQLILIHLTKRLLREFSVQKSVHSRYTVSGILERSENKKHENYSFPGFFRGSYRIRTYDPLLVRQVL